LHPPLIHLQLTNNYIRKISNIPESIEYVALQNNNINDIESLPKSTPFLNLHSKIISIEGLKLCMDLDLLYCIETNKILEVMPF